MAANGFVKGEEEEMASDDVYPEGPLPSAHDSLKRVKKTRSRVRMHGEIVQAKLYCVNFYSEEILLLL